MWVPILCRKWQPIVTLGCQLPSRPASLSFISFFILPFILSKAKLSICALVYSPLLSEIPLTAISSSGVFNISVSWPGTSSLPATSPPSLTSQPKGTLVCSSDCYWRLVIQSPSFFWKQLPLALVGRALVTMWSASLALLPAGEPMPLSSGLGSAWGGVGCSKCVSEERLTLASSFPSLRTGPRT